MKDSKIITKTHILSSSSLESQSCVALDALKTFKNPLINVNVVFHLIMFPTRELQNWFNEVQQALETAYTSASTPWQQSGKSGTFEDWVRLRLANLSPVNNSATYLDIGCANGYLLECLLAWAKLKGVEILPYGLDFSAQFINLAQKRLANYASNFYVCNVWDWRPRVASVIYEKFPYNK